MSSVQQLSQATRRHSRALGKSRWIRLSRYELARRRSQFEEEVEGPLTELVRRARSQGEEGAIRKLVDDADRLSRSFSLLFPDPDYQDFDAACLYFRWYPEALTKSMQARLESAAETCETPRVRSGLQAVLRRIREREDSQKAEDVLKNLGRGEKRGSRRLAAELYQLGIATRRAEDRPSLVKASQNRLPDPHALPKLVQLLSASDEELRCQTALAIGEWGGDDAVGALLEHLRENCAIPGQENYCAHLILALESIGGENAAEAIRAAAEAGDERVQLSAVTALEELLSGRQVAMHEGRPQFDRDPAISASANSNRNVRLREIRNTLQRLAGDPKRSRVVRQSARDALSASWGQIPA